MKIGGNLNGIRKTYLKRLNDLFNIKYSPDSLVDTFLAIELANVSGFLGREIAVYLDRRGCLESIMIGDRHTVPLLKDMRRRDPNSLSGLRCIHTHPDASGELSPLDISSLLEARFDAMIAIGVKDREIVDIYMATPVGINNYNILGPLSLNELTEISFQGLITDIEKNIFKPSVHNVEEKEPKALLISFNSGNNGSLHDAAQSLNELKELAFTANIYVHATMLLKLTKPDPSTYLRKGKLHDLSLFRQQEAIDIIILDTSLSPKQQSNLEDFLGCDIADRTAVILQIFAQRAKTKEGKLQVELAQLNYILPRLAGSGHYLSRLGGGIGTRGPGETKLETDRRKIRTRINELHSEIENIRKQRQVLRQKRTVNEIPVIALVGYTNAGKSTLMNALTSANVFVENKLFATLDPITKRINYAEQELLLTDTVGFIDKLPHQLVSAFRATLEEITHADLLLHVVNAADPAREGHIDTVNRVLEEIGVKNKQVLLVFNKCDIIEDQVEVQNEINKYYPALAISALNRTNLEILLDMILEYLPQKLKTFRLHIPYDNLATINKIYTWGHVLEIEYKEDHIFCIVSLRTPIPDFIEQYIIADSIEG